MQRRVGAAAEQHHSPGCLRMPQLARVHQLEDHPEAFEALDGVGWIGCVNQFAFRAVTRDDPQELRRLRRTGWVGTAGDDPVAYDADQRDAFSVLWDRDDDWHRWLQDQVRNFGSAQRIYDVQQLAQYICDHPEFEDRLHERGWCGLLDPMVYYHGRGPTRTRR